MAEKIYVTGNIHNPVLSGLNERIRNGEVLLHFSSIDEVKQLELTSRSSNEPLEDLIKVPCYMNIYISEKKVSPEKIFISVEWDKDRPPISWLGLPKMEFAERNDPDADWTQVYGYKCNAPDEELYDAAKKGVYALALNAIRFDANVNYVRFPKEYGYTPLHLAAYYGRLNIITLLIEHGCDLNPVSVDGKTPLALAKERHGRKAVIEYMEAHGCLDFVPKESEKIAENGLSEAEEMERE